MTNRFFKDLKEDELLNFSVAVVVMKFQRRWRSRVRWVDDRWRAEDDGQSNM